MPKLRAFVLWSFVLVWPLQLRAMAPMGVPAPPPGPTFVAAVSGPWNDSATWAPQPVPTDGAIVDIPPGITVTLSDDTKRIRWVQVRGTLALSAENSSRLFVDTLVIHDSGAFTLQPYLPQTRVAEVIFTSSGPFESWDGQAITRGLISAGTVNIHGVSKSYMKRVAGDVRNGATELTLESAPSHWRAGDRIVLAGTFFRRQHDGLYEPQHEERVILSVDGATVRVTQPFSHDHLRVSSTSILSGITTTPALHVANLTRNVRFKSESVANTYDRGHIMLMNENSTFDNVAFIDLGRTDKSIPLDDFKVDWDAEPVRFVKNGGVVSNRRGRYSLHVHMARNPASYQGTIPAQPPTVVTGCVVDGAIGWGFVNHSSHVDFRRNVAYRFVGAGFVTEAGDELGNFFDNIAIYGIGLRNDDGDPAYYDARLNFRNRERPQATADVAFSGVGFWFSGPALRVANIVANSCNGDGIIWHTTGTVDVNQSNAALGYDNGAPFGVYTGLPEEWLPLVYDGGELPSGFEPRLWSPGKVVIADLPILRCTGVESYANLIGFRLRFSNFDSHVWYNESPFNYEAQIEGDVEHRAQQKVGSDDTIFHLWNNEESFSARYVDRTTVTRLQAINRLDYDAEDRTRDPAIAFADGVEGGFKTECMQWIDPIVDGYEVALWVVSPDSKPVTIVNGEYLNEAAETEFTAACAPAAPQVTAVAGAGGIADVSWPAVAGAVKYLLRYKATGEQQWKFAEPAVAANPSHRISGLTAGQPYVVQVIWGCANGVGLWSAPAGVTGQ